MLGQDGSDLTKSANSTGADGYQDVHVQLAGIPSYRQIASIDVSRYGGGTWQYNVPNGPHFAAALVRSSGANIADLYFQPAFDDQNVSYAISIHYVGLIDPVTLNITVTAQAQLPV